MDEHRSNPRHSIMKSYNPRIKAPKSLGWGQEEEEFHTKDQNPECHQACSERNARSQKTTEQHI